MNVLVLGVDESDCLDSILASPTVSRYRENHARISLVWLGAFSRITSTVADKLFVTLRMSAHPDAVERDRWVAACSTRVKGPDGLIPSQRIGAQP